MPSPRELRKLVPVEVLCVLALAIAPLPDALPRGAPMLLFASLSRWLRGRSWRELAQVRVGPLVAAVLAGGIAIAAAAPLVHASGTTAVESWFVPAARAGGGRLCVLALVLVVHAVALELALRGWIIERMLELSPGTVGLPILAAALAEALVVPEPIAPRIGALLFGAGLGILYTAANRNVLVPILARCTFVLGTVALAALAPGG